MAKKKTTKKRSVKKAPVKKNSVLMAIIALIFNIILPGIGSLIGGRIKTGIWQLVLIVIALSAIIFLPITIFYIVLAVDWVWALVTSIQLIQRT